MLKWTQIAFFNICQLWLYTILINFHYIISKWMALMMALIDSLWHAAALLVCVSCCPCVMGVSLLECIFPYQSSWSMLSEFTTSGPDRMLQCDRLIKSNMKAWLLYYLLQGTIWLIMILIINAELSGGMDAYVEPNHVLRKLYFKLPWMKCHINIRYLRLQHNVSIFIRFVPILKFGASTPSWCHRLDFCVSFCLNELCVAQLMHYPL
jgi:hypothetical protein